MCRWSKQRGRWMHYNSTRKLNSNSQGRCLMQKFIYGLTINGSLWLRHPVYTSLHTEQRRKVIAIQGCRCELSKEYSFLKGGSPQNFAYSYLCHQLMRGILAASLNETVSESEQLIFSKHQWGYFCYINISLPHLAQIINSCRFLAIFRPSICLSSFCKCPSSHRDVNEASRIALGEWHNMAQLSLQPRPSWITMVELLECWSLHPWQILVQWGACARM